MYGYCVCINQYEISICIFVMGASFLMCVYVRVFICTYVCSFLIARPNEAVHHTVEAGDQSEVGGEGVWEW